MGVQLGAANIAKLAICRFYLLGVQEHRSVGGIRRTSSACDLWLRLPVLISANITDDSVPHYHSFRMVYERACLIRMSKFSWILSVGNWMSGNKVGIVDLVAVYIIDNGE